MLALQSIYLSSNAPMPRRPQTPSPHQPWPATTELVGLEFTLQPTAAGTVPLHHPRLLHAWFLDQIRQFDPQLSAYLHDGGGHKPFALSGLTGSLQPEGKQYRLDPDTTYTWRITALDATVAQGLATWLERLPKRVELQRVSLGIQQWSVVLPATTYAQLLETPVAPQGKLCLSFLTPTSFKHRGHHLPLPVPKNIFESYLRRWNLFANFTVPTADFLDWIDENIAITRCILATATTHTTAQGIVIGFTGSVEFRCLGQPEPEYERMFWALGQLAPYVGTGHRTPYGLGQTRHGWQPPAPNPSRVITATPLPVAQPIPPSSRRQLTARIKELTALFKAQRKRQGGTRAEDIAKVWATILARREAGESVRLIALDLELPFETAKTYLKLARRTIN
jgi:CRISPR-associated endoribonuclease Cas6